MEWGNGPQDEAGDGARQARESRCPDGGYCHGSTLAAESPPCAAGQCLRVITSGPLSGVFPGNCWPEEVLAAIKRPEVSQPDGTPLREAIRLSGRLTNELRMAVGAYGGLEEVPGHLQNAAKLATAASLLIESAHHALTGEGTADPEANELSKRVSAVMEMVRQPVGPRGKEISQERWQTQLKGLLAQIFLLGMSIGWDKHAAVHGEKTGKSVSAGT